MVAYIKKCSEFIKESKKYVDNKYRDFTDPKFKMYYYLVIRRSPESIYNILSGTLHNLYSISNDPNIVHAFFDIRDIILLMPRTDVDTNNILEKVDYDNVEAALKDDMLILKRLFDTKGNSYDNDSIWYQIIQKQWQLDYEDLYGGIRFKYLKKRFKKFQDYYKIITSTMYSHYGDFKVDSLSDLVLFIQSELPKKALASWKHIIDLSDTEKLSNAVEYVVLRYMLLFAREGEVFVKNKTFKIPDSTIIVYKDYSTEYPEMQRLIKHSKYKTIPIQCGQSSYNNSDYQKVFDIIKEL